MTVKIDKNFPYKSKIMYISSTNAYVQFFCLSLSVASMSCIYPYVLMTKSPFARLFLQQLGHLPNIPIIQ